MTHKNLDSMTPEEMKTVILALRRTDHDSFATFTSGLRSNWVFLIGIVAVAMWVFNNFDSQSTTNLQQDARIESLAGSLTQLTNTVNNIVLREEKNGDAQASIQKDIALMQADISVIKDTLNK